MIAESKIIGPEWIPAKKLNASSALPRVLRRHIKAHEQQQMDQRSNSYHEGAHVVFYNLYGLKAATHGEKEEGSTTFYYHKDHTETEFYGALGRAIWEDLGPRVDLSKENGTSTPTLSVDDDIPPHPSERSRELSHKVRSYWDKGINRSFLLYGPPGTGKTTLAYAIARDLAGFTLNVSVENIDIAMLRTLLRILQPQIVLFNDLDRSSQLEQLLNLFEQMNNNHKLVLGSVNAKRKLPIALRRPGRFDELIEITTLGPEILAKVTEEFPPAIRSQVQGWPMSFIQELRKRVRVNGLSCIETEFAELAARVALNEQEDELDFHQSGRSLSLPYDDDDDEE
jgi:hypothetical protein